jgi:hypothetical protein
MRAHGARRPMTLGSWSFDSALQEQKEIFYGTKVDHAARHRESDIRRAIKHGMSRRAIGHAARGAPACSTPYAVCPMVFCTSKELIENQLWLTETATGQLVFHIFGTLAEFKRNLIKERTMAGLSAAGARGRKGGRPKLKTQDSKVATAKKLYYDRTMPITDICNTLHISRVTLFRWANAGGGSRAKP